jgi:hypothetical protein
MNAAAFIGDFVRRFGCTVQIGGREFDSMGRGADKGGACATCGECSRDLGDMGLAAEGVAIIQTINGLHLSWSCPGCSRETVEDTTLFAAAKQASACIEDGLCYSCRALKLKDDQTHE